MAKDIVTRINAQEVFGDVCWWSLENITITQPELAALFARHGLSERYLPPVAPDHATFRQAIAAHVNNRRKKGRVSSLLLRPVLENEDEIIYAVVDETVIEEQETLAHNVPHRIVFKKATGKVSLRDGATVLGKQVKDWYEAHVGRLNTTDLRRALVKAIVQHMGGICLRARGGGLYFVPASAGKDLRCLQKVVEEWGPGETDFGVLEQARSERNKAQLSSDVRRSLDQEVKDLIEEVKAWNEKAPRHDTMQRRLGEYKGLKDRVLFFQNLLGITVDDLNLSLAELEAQVKGISDDKPLSQAAKRREARKARREAAQRKARLVRRAAE